MSTNNSKQDKRNRFFTEAALNLRCGGFAVGKPNEDTLPVELNGQRLCQVTDSGAVRYWKEDVTGDAEAAALDKVIDIAKATAEYMSLMETAPNLTVGSLKGDYRLLADFDGTILAGHPTKYDGQFVTWDWSHDRTALDHGNYYGPSVGADAYTSAKQNFSTRSGLVPRSALFAPEQLAEVYRSIRETLESIYPITYELPPYPD